MSLENGSGSSSSSAEAGVSRARKRKLMLDNADDDYSGGIQSEMGKFLSTSTKKHTIDSDEEEDELDADEYNKQKYDVMDNADIEGQEEQTVEFDGETKITPFNMNDELEEGYFDGSGMYIWNKRDADEVKDSWLDSVDWMKVQNPADKAKSKSTESDSEEEKTKDDILVYYRELLKFLTPKETILKAIKRLGGGSKQLSASERLKQKKLAKKEGLNPEMKAAGTSSAMDTSSESEVNQLTELVNKIMYSSGYMDIYDETYESITFKLNKGSST